VGFSSHAAGVTHTSFCDVCGRLDLRKRYADGNKAGKPVGSGSYAVNLNATQYGAKNAGVYGCKFDADGNPTTSGAATINNQTGDIDVVVAQQ